jgi:cell division protein FtsB
LDRHSFAGYLKYGGLNRVSSFDLLAMDLRKFLQSKFAALVLSGILLFVMLAAAKLIMQKREVDREIAQLEAKADEIQRDNQELSELIKYFNTPEYAERQAREKLNLKKEGEHVVVLPRDEEETGNVAGVNSDQRNNPKKWFDYFFGK